eukprot:9047028-Pyramimonas_sp.AAC.1
MFGGWTEEAQELDTPPSVLSTALVWGLFMGTSANTRYQVRHPPLAAPVAFQILTPQDKQIESNDHIGRSQGEQQQH